MKKKNDKFLTYSVFMLLKLIIFINFYDLLENANKSEVFGNIFDDRKIGQF